MSTDFLIDNAHFARTEDSGKCLLWWTRSSPIYFYILPHFSEAGSFCGQQNDLYEHICVYLYNITNMFWTDGDEINTNSRHEQRYSSRKKHFIASRNDATI
jgi:hypothetical protein